MMHNVITREAAAKLRQRLDSTGCPLAVFAANGSFNATKVTTELCAKALKSQPEKLIGIYDLNARLEWLQDDLAAAGIK